ncbi:MAG: phosphotransferase family protein [Acidimicrobiales bacterium]|nr:phosphotransferase family protein [Acidimicrobiales bacterium]
MSDAIDHVDLDQLASWMDQHGLGEGPLADVTELTGGTQNILLRFERSGRSYVLRHPPRHKRKNSDETMRREARVLGALAGSDVPHPGLIAAEPSLDVLGSAFYLMEPVEGFNPSEGLPAPHRDDADLRHAMGLSMAAAAASLSRVDHVAVGLGDFGKPDGWLERQVERWRGQLRGYDQLDGYPGPDIPGVERVADWLEANQPPTWEPGIIHGDLHFANVLVRHDGPELAAVVDWELCTIGDPLLDVGHLLATWPEDGGVPGGVGGSITDLPSKDELVAHYATLSTRAVDDIDWFHVLACYRLGIILEGTHARAFAGKAPKDIGDLLHATTVGLFERALGVIDDA